MSWEAWNGRKQEQSPDWYLKQQVRQLQENRNHLHKRLHLLEVRSQQQEHNINEMAKFIRELHGHHMATTWEPRVAGVEKQILRIEDRCRFWIDNLDARVRALEDNMVFYQKQIKACEQEIHDLKFMD